MGLPNSSKSSAVLQLKIKTLANKKQKYFIPLNILNAFSFDKQGGKEEYTPKARLLKTTHLVCNSYKNGELVSGIKDE